MARRTPLLIGSACETKSQHGHALLRQRQADITCAFEVFTAGKAMSKDRISPRFLTQGQVELDREGEAAAVGKRQGNRFHVQRENWSQSTSGTV